MKNKVYRQNIVYRHLNKQAFGQAAKQAGFSLLELLVVMALIAGIMALVASQVMGKSEEARAEQARIDAAFLVGEIEMYRVKKRKMPDSLDVLNLPEDKKADPWGNPYQLRKPGKNGPYDIVSLGADGREGGEEVNEDIVVGQ